jgi:hypothetical protein
VAQPASHNAHKQSHQIEPLLKGLGICRNAYGLICFELGFINYITKLELKKEGFGIYVLKKMYLVFLKK